MKLVIDRSIWLRGEPEGSMLLRPNDGKMCCVGIYLAACGVPHSRLSSKRSAADKGVVADDGSWLVERRNNGLLCSSAAAIRLYEENDCWSNATDRESKIAELFAANGVDVEFVDGATS